MAPKAAQRVEVLATNDGNLSADDLVELRARSARADDAFAQGECVAAGVVLAELDEILSGA